MFNKRFGIELEIVVLGATQAAVKAFYEARKIQLAA